MNAYTINLRNLLQDHDLTQQQVAEYLGTSQTTVSYTHLTLPTILLV